MSEDMRPNGALLADIKEQAQGLAGDIAEAARRGFTVQWSNLSGGKVNDFKITRTVEVDINGRWPKETVQ